MTLRDLVEQNRRTERDFQRAAEAMIPAMQQAAQAMNRIGITAAALAAWLEAHGAALHGPRPPDPEWAAYLNEYYDWREEQGLNECLCRVRCGPVTDGHLAPSTVAAYLPPGPSG